MNQKSGAQINVLPNTEEQSLVNFLIQGSPEQILVAQCALEKLATDCEVITDVIDVPQTAFGRIIGWHVVFVVFLDHLCFASFCQHIISCKTFEMLFASGRGGETLKFMNRVSGARVHCSKDRGRSLEEMGKITVTGTRKEIQSAKVRF